jgi:hypothetical protein
MISCSDPILTQLKDKGYNVIRLPRLGIRPLDVLAGTNSELDHLGALHTVWTSSTKEPVPYEPRATSNIAGGTSRAIKASLGLSILNDLLAGFGVSAPKVKTAFGQTRTLTFKYDQPKQWGIAPFEIGSYLAAGDLAEGNPVLDKHLRDSRLYLITEILLSNSLTVVAEAKTSSNTAVDGNMLKDAVQAKLDVSVEEGEQSSITFAGKHDVAFGFKAFELSFSDGKWTIGEFAEPGSISFDTAKLTADPAPVLFGGPMLQLSSRAT